jgi:small redox-active disulfide protein 2
MLNIKVVGSGCPNCQKLAALCSEVIEENNISAEIEKVTDINTFADLGILVTPGLLIDNKVVSWGKIPAKSLLTEWITEAGRASSE